MDDRQQRLTIGTCPAISLSDARDKAIDVMRSPHKGGDPARERQRERIAAQTRELRIFHDIADADFKACEAGGWMPTGRTHRPRTLADSRAVNKRHVRPVIGSMWIEVRAPDLADPR